MFKAEKIGNDIYGVKSNWKLESSLGDTAETGFRHNYRYHKYFYGYTEVRVEQPNGRYSIKRIYTDDWYRQDINDKTWIMTKFLMLILCAFAAIFYGFVMTREGFSGNTNSIVAIPGFCSVILLILLIAASIQFVFTNRKMTWWEQHSSRERMDKISIVTAAMLGLTSILIIANCFFGVDNIGKEVVLGICVLLCSIACFVMYLINKKIKYITVKNEVQLPEGERHLIL